MCVCVFGVCLCVCDLTKSHLKSLSFLISVQTWGLIDVALFLTIFPLFLLCTFSWFAFVLFSGLMSMQALKNSAEQHKYFSFRHNCMKETYQESVQYNLHQ